MLFSCLYCQWINDIYRITKNLNIYNCLLCRNEIERCPLMSWLSNCRLGQHDNPSPLCGQVELMWGYIYDDLYSLVFTIKCLSSLY